MTDTLTVTFDGTTCLYEGSTQVDAAVVGVEFVNSSATDAWMAVRDADELRVEIAAAAGGANSGFMSMRVAGPYTVECGADPGAGFAGPTLEVRAG